MLVTVGNEANRAYNVDPAQGDLSPFMTTPDLVQCGKKIGNHSAT